MRRREFIAGLGSAAAWPLAAHAQQAQTPVIGYLSFGPSEASTSKRAVSAFLQGLKEIGYVDGRNVRIEYRWAAENIDRDRQYSAELVALAPDVILASASPNLAALQRVTRSIPIVFANVIDPVGAGFVASLARPGGNTTGFSAFEYSLGGKWLELLKEIAPNVTRNTRSTRPLLRSSI